MAKKNNRRHQCSYCFMMFCRFSEECKFFLFVYAFGIQGGFVVGWLVVVQIVNLMLMPEFTSQRLYMHTRKASKDSSYPLGYFK